jgi:hypothetical protein
MNWESVIKAYPSQEEVILGIKALHEKIERAMSGLDIPEIHIPCRDMNGLTTFVPLLAPACKAVWEETTGSAPVFDMEEALSSGAGGQNGPGMEGADNDLLQAIMHNAFSRLLHLLREKNPRLLPDSWSQGDCPFCGTYARMGFDSEDKRMLHCLSCGHSWRFPRLRCPSCGNADFNTRGYFEAEGIDGVRVYFCRECSHYLKIVDTKSRIAEDPETEDALTLELDDLADKEGFV